MARELLEPLLSPARSIELGTDRSSLVPALARVDPARVLDMIENRAVADLSGTLIQVALGQYEDSPAQAIATIGDSRDPVARAAGWLALEDFRPAPDRARREDLLDRALADARSATRGDVKVWLLGQIADRWLELGSVERARPILLEGQAIVAAWPKEQWFFEAEGFRRGPGRHRPPGRHRALRASRLEERLGGRNRDDQPPQGRGRDPARKDRPGRGRAVDRAGFRGFLRTAGGRPEGRPQDGEGRPAQGPATARNPRRRGEPGPAGQSRARPLRAGRDRRRAGRHGPDPGPGPAGRGVLRPSQDRRRGQPGAGSGLRRQPDGGAAADRRAARAGSARRTDLAGRGLARPSVQEPKGEELQGTFALAMLVARYDRASPT